MAAVLERSKIKPAPESVTREAAVFRVLDSLRPGECLRLGGVSWEDYEEFDRWRDELRPNLKMAYSDGELEFMTTSFEHDSTSRTLQNVLVMFAMAWSMPIRAAGSTTFRKKLKKKGIEPDECFYIQHAAKVRGLKEIDLKIHPAPDLAIEMDRSNSSLPKLPIYAALGFPELWRVEGDTVTFYSLKPTGEYAKSKASRAFPLVKSAELSRFFFGTDWADDTELMLAAREWAAALSK